MPTFLRLRHAAAAVSVALLAGLTGCGSASTALDSAATDTPSVTADPPVVTPVPARRTKPAASRAAARPTFGLHVTTVAAKYAGTPYVWGGTTPRGFDCSGFTKYVYAKLGKALPHSSSDQFRTARKVGKQVHMGDLIFFHARGGHVDHVGIYAGDGLMWHAPNARKPVRLDKISSQPKRWSGGRL